MDVPVDLAYCLSLGDVGEFLGPCVKDRCPQRSQSSVKLEHLKQTTTPEPDYAQTGICQSFQFRCVCLKADENARESWCHTNKIMAAATVSVSLDQGWTNPVLNEQNPAEDFCPTG